MKKNVLLTTYVKQLRKHHTDIRAQLTFQFGRYSETKVIEKGSETATAYVKKGVNLLTSVFV